MPIPFLAAAAGGALLKGLGKFFGKKSQDKTNRQQGEAMNAAGAASFNNAETKRINNLKTLQAAAQARGLPLTIGPELFERMQNPTPDYTKMQPNTGSTLGGFLGGIGDIGMGYAVHESQKPTMPSAPEMAGPPSGMIASSGQPVGDGVSDEFIQRLLDELDEGVYGKQPPIPFRR